MKVVTPDCPICGEPMIRELRPKGIFFWICFNSHTRAEFDKAILKGTK